MPHLIRRMRCLLKDNKKTLYKNLVIYNIRTFTILSPQNKGGTGTFKLHKIYKRVTITVVSELKKVILK